MYKKLNRFIVIILCAIILFTASCGDGSNGGLSGQNGKVRKLFILKNSSIHSDLINEQIKKGIEKVSTEIGNFTIEFSQPITSLVDAEKYLKEFLKSDPDFVLACDPSYQKIIDTASKEHPNVKFSILEGSYEKLDEKGNLATYRYHETEIGYLTAFVAVKFSQSKKIALISGVADSVRMAFRKGFEKGVLDHGNEVDDEVEYLGTTDTAFENNDYANVIARKYFSKGCDIILHNAGNASKGIFDAAVKEQKYVIGYAVDQTYDVSEYAKKIFYTSIIKKYDIATYEAVKNFDAKVFVGGKIFIGFKEDAIGYTSNNANNKITSLKGDIEKLIDGVKGERYIIPDVDE